MNRSRKPILAFFILTTLVALTGCTLGKAAEPSPTAVDVNAVMTSAAATAFLQLTEIAGLATATLPPTATPTPEATATAETSSTTNEETTAAPPPLAIGTPDPSGAPGLPTAIPTVTPAPPPGGAATPMVLCKNSAFVGDLTIPDGTILKPGEKFAKIWQVKNTGVCAWDEGFGIVLWAGPAMGGENDFFSGKERVEPGGIVDMTIHMKAPWEPGEYVAHWVMVDDNNQPFGTDLVVYIIVQK